MRAKDSDGAYSAYSSTCTFSIDRARPSKPPLITSQDNAYPNGDQGWPQNTGPARTTTRFLLAANGVTDVKAYYRWTDSDPDLKETTPDAAWADVSIPSYGPHLLYTYSVDAAGNRSDTAAYLYYATHATDRDQPGDLNGDGYGDAALMYYYPDYSHRLWTFLGQSNGTYKSPFSSWYSTGNRWGAIGRATLQAGDFNGDGLDDLGAMYGYNDGTVKMFTWLAKPDATFDPIKVSWASSTTTAWSYTRTKFVNRYTS
ncbi:FG-GAP repeat domain-containing protein [Streptomyces sp. NPDC003522]